MSAAHTDPMNLPGEGLVPDLTGLAEPEENVTEQSDAVEKCSDGSGSETPTPYDSTPATGDASANPEPSRPKLSLLHGHNGANSKAEAQPDDQVEPTPPGGHSAPEPRRSVFTGRELLEVDVAKPIPIVEGLFFEGKDSIMGGAYGIGKTTASLHIATGIAAGETVFGLRVTRPYRTLYLDLELGISEFKQRYRVIQALCSNQERLNENFVYVDASPDSPYSGKLKFDGAGGSNRILELIKACGAEFVIVDNLSLAFVGDLENPADCMRLRERVSEIRSRNPVVRSFFLPTHLTKPDPEHMPSLLNDPRQWLRKVRGSGKLLDHFTIRLGLDSVHIEGNEIQVLNGISSHGRISPICLERFCDEEGASPPYLKPHSDSELKARTILTINELEFWKGLPSRFRSADIKAHPKHATGFRMLAKAKDNGLVTESTKGIYAKV